MTKRIPDQIVDCENRSRRKSRYVNIAIWVIIALIAALIAVVTVWAARQPEIRSMWAPE